MVFQIIINKKKQCKQHGEIEHVKWSQSQLYKHAQKKSRKWALSVWRIWLQFYSPSRAFCRDLAKWLAVARTLILVILLENNHISCLSVSFCSSCLSFFLPIQWCHKPTIKFYVRSMSFIRNCLILHWNQIFLCNIGWCKGLLHSKLLISNGHRP